MVRSQLSHLQATPAKRAKKQAGLQPSAPGAPVLPFSTAETGDTRANTVGHAFTSRAARDAPRLRRADWGWTRDSQAGTERVWVRVTNMVGITDKKRNVGNKYGRIAGTLTMA